MNKIKLCMNICKTIFNTDKDYVAVRYIAYIILSISVSVLPTIIMLTYDAEKRDLSLKESDIKDLIVK